jgi:hypothetical protein
MKLLFIITVFISIFGTNLELTEIREAYVNAPRNKEVTMKLSDKLSSVSKKDSPVLVAYKGAVLTIKAKFAKGKNNKKELFKEGAELLEYAVKTSPNNIEIRTLRLSIQENTPKFLKYHKNIVQDKQFILDHFKGIASMAEKVFVRSYVLQSEGFSDSEKELF